MIAALKVTALQFFACASFCLAQIGLSADPLDTWTLRNQVNPTSGSAFAITYGNGVFLASNASGTFVTSPDGVTWTIRHSGFSYLRAISHGAGQFVAVGSTGILTSLDNGVTWNVAAGTTHYYLNAIAYGEGLFVAGSGKTFLSSPDGVTWTPHASGGTDNIVGITYGNGLFVVVGAEGTIVTSPDGVAWTQRNTGTTQDLNSVAYGSGQFVAVGGLWHNPDFSGWRDLGSTRFRRFYLSEWNLLRSRSVFRSG